jgi:polysaccharide deacetylase 2 family uncharacterized protein YibQ
MAPQKRPLIRSLNPAVPALAGALVASAYLVGAVVFSVTSQANAGVPADTAADMAVDVASAAAPERLPAPVSVDVAAIDRPHESGAKSTRTPVTRPTERSTVLAETDLLPSGPRIALVIDDVGLDLDAARRTIALDAGVSLAVLPYAEAAATVSAEAAAAGHDVLLHMPMEPVGLADPGPNALRLGLSDADLTARMRWAMARVPDAIGLNNHMGSRFTTDPRAMRVALAAVSDRHPLFLDSLTTGESRGRAVADGLGLATLERDIFLDHVPTAGEVAARLDEVEALARSRGWAVAIGHPHAETLDVLEDWIVAARARGITFVTVSALSDQIARTAMPTADAGSALQ